MDMSFLHITYYTFLRNIRDWKFLILLIVAPFITILVTGNATVNIDQRKQVEKNSVIYLDADGGQLAGQFNQFLKTKEIANSFTIKNITSFDDGYNQIKDGKADSFIYLKKYISEKFSHGEKTKIEVYSNKTFSPAKILVEGFVNTVNASSAIKGIGGQLDFQDISRGVKQIAISPTGKVPNSLDKWTYLNILLFHFYGAILGSFTIINGIRKRTQMRLNLAPINPFAHVTGIFLGNLLTLFICTILLIGITYFALGSNWHGNMVIILLTFLEYSSITIALGMIIGYLTKRLGLSVLLIVSMNSLLGFCVAFFTEGAINNFIKWLTLVSPHLYSYKIITDVIFEGPSYRLQMSMISLALVAAVLMLFTLILGRRKPI